mgnify:FL=1
MNEFNKIVSYFSNFTVETVIDIIIAIGITVFFRIFSTGIANVTTKLLRKKIKKADRRKSALYNTTRKLVNLIGIYIAIIFLKRPLLISTIILGYITKVFKVLVIYSVARIIAEAITMDTFRKFSNNDEDEGDGISTFVVKIIRGLVYIVATFIAVLELGYDLSGLVTGLGISSVVITLAAQNLAKDLLGGFVIFTDKPFKVGDWIQFKDYEGTVEDITYRSTRLRTFENSIVNIPNSIIANESLINCSKIEKRRYKINLGITLETPLNKVKIIEEKIKTMLKEKEAVMDDSIIVKFDKITDNTINLLIYAFTDSVDYGSFLKQKEEINFKIMQILESENVELAYDTKTVYVKQ